MARTIHFAAYAKRSASKPTRRDDYEHSKCSVRISLWVTHNDAKVCLLGTCTCVVDKNNFSAILLMFPATPEATASSPSSECAERCSVRVSPPSAGWSSHWNCVGSGRARTLQVTNVARYGAACSCGVTSDPHTGASAGENEQVIQDTAIDSRYLFVKK